MRAHAAGWQLGIHTMGDTAHQAMLDAIEAALRAHPREDPRHRIEHGTFPTAAQQHRIAALGMTPVTQPGSIRELGDVWTVQLGERIHRTMPLRSMLDLGIRPVISSDAFVQSYRPLDTISAATFRVTPSGLRVGPDEELTIEEAMRAHTLDAARVLGWDDRLGSLEPGKLADLAVVDGDLLAAVPERIGELRVWMTMLDGAIVHDQRTAAGVGARLTMPHVQTVLGASTRGRSASPCRTSTPRSRCGTSRTAGTTGSSPRDEPVILDELAAFRQAGGGTLVDLTLPGVGRDPLWLRALSEQSGLNLVMGCGWYRHRLLPARGAHRPAHGRRPRRGAHPRGDRGRRRDRDPARDHRRDRHRQAVADRRGGARPPCGGARGEQDGPVGHDPRRDVGRRAAPSSAIFEEEGLDPARVVVGHADSYPDAAYHAAIVGRGANVEFDFLGMDFTPVERHGEGRVLACCCELLEAGHTERILLSQDVCHDSRWPLRGHGYTYLAETFLPRLRARGGRKTNPHADRRQPKPAPRRSPDAAAAPSGESDASTSRATLPFSAWLIGQLSRASSASS